MLRVLTLLFLFPLVIAAQPKEPPAKEPTTEELIAQLGHKTFAVREKAMATLRKRGPIVLPDLKKALAGNDAEVRERLETLIPELEKVAALTPKKINLKAQQKTILEIAKDISTQAGFEIRVNGSNSSVRYDVDIKEATFWDALLQLQKTTGYGLAKYSYDKYLALEKTDTLNPFIHNHGPVRLELKHLHEDRDQFFNQKGKDPLPFQRTHVLQLKFQATVEPRYSIWDTLDPQMDTMLDEAQKPYTLREQPKDTYRSRDRWGQTFGYDCELHIQRTVDSSKNISVLKGTLPVNLVIEKKPVVISDEPEKANGTKFRVGQNELRVTQASINNNGGNVEILIPSDDGRQNSGMWQQRLHLEDDAGRRYGTNGSGSSSNGREYRISVYFGTNGQKLGPPKRIVIEDWITVSYPVPFTMKDIPLP